MKIPTNAVLLTGALALAAVCLYAASRDEMPWWPGIFFAFCTLSFVRPYFNWRRAHEQLEVSDWGIRRTFGARPEENNVEAVSWDALSKVEIRTTNSGPWSEDMFFVLHGADGKGALVSNDLAVKHQLVKALQERLPGLDDRAIIEASGCTSNKAFLVWQKS